MEAMRLACEKFVSDVYKNAQERMDETGNAARVYVDSAIEMAKAIAESAETALRETAERENAMTEALLLTDEIMAYLIQNSALPEVEKDRMTVIANKIAAQIKEVKKPKEVSGDDEA